MIIQNYIIVALVIVCGALGLKLQTAQYNEKETQLIHEKLIAESDARNANVIATAQRQRQLEAERYASEVNIINDKYNDALSKSNRVQQEITNYNTRLDTTNRETLENYAQTSSILFGECRGKYLELGYYTSKIDAELDSKTSPSK